MMKKRLFAIALICGIFGSARIHAACGTDPWGEYCESYVGYAGAGTHGPNNLTAGVVYVTLSDDPSWFWDDSDSKNMTLASLLAAKSSGQKIQVRWVPESQTNGVGVKRIISILAIPD